MTTDNCTIQLNYIINLRLGDESELSLT